MAIPSVPSNQGGPNALNLAQEALKYGKTAPEVERNGLYNTGAAFGLNLASKAIINKDRTIDPDVKYNLLNRDPGDVAYEATYLKDLYNKSQPSPQTVRSKLSGDEVAVPGDAKGDQETGKKGVVI